MKTYRVEITDTANGDLREITRYIHYGLGEPQTAYRLYCAIREEILSLGYMPERYPPFTEEPWYSMGIRKMLVKNYVVFYSVDHEQQAVEVRRIFYAGRDLAACLNDTDWDNL